PRPLPPDGAVTLNEILPAPRAVDWDGNGTTDHTDEWVELYNSLGQPVDLGGWRLWKGAIGADGLPDGFFYTFPKGTLLPPYSYLLIFYRQSRLSLPNTNGNLHLVRPDSRIADSFTWTASPGYDRSFSRYPDGNGAWGVGAVTAGLPNHPHPPPAPPPTGGPAATPVPDPGLGVGVEPIARAYELSLDTRMTVEGVVTVPPGLFGSRVLYLQDESGGLRVYLRSGEYPSLALGDRLRVTGYLRAFHGQRELNLPSPRWLVWLGNGPAPRPRFLRTGQVGERFVGRLVIVTGAVVGFRDNHFWVDDGSGQIRVTVDADLPWRRPYFRRNSIWTVIGVVGRYDDFYRLLPRYPTDIVPAPGLLPLTGGGANSDENCSGRCR
ncbi:MAG: lamin tail domain-containing protein, partial [Caldilineales bacterium]|nr:lamin tail domain-containing protein [Caldilineales bacterium]